MSGYPMKVSILDWDSESRYLATAAGETVILWDCSGKGPANTQPLELAFHSELLSSLAFQHKGPLLASSCQQGKISLWYPGKRKQILVSDQLVEGISHLSWSPSDDRLAVGGDEGALAMYQV